MSAEMEPDFQPCAFCRRLSVGHFLVEDESTVVFRDAHPLTEGHLHIAPRRHYRNFFRIPESDRLDMIEALWRAWSWLERNYSPAGYNIGINVGEAAGQSVPHANIHLIPRYGRELLDRPRGSRWMLGGKGARRSLPSEKELIRAEILSENKLAFLLGNPRPLSEGHALVMLRKKKSDFFAMGELERDSFWDMIASAPQFIKTDRAPDGYNIGIDIGSVAGQEGDTLLAHILPRWQGDSEEEFGVRWMAGEHSDYQSRRLGN